MRRPERRLRSAARAPVRSAGPGTAGASSDPSPLDAPLDLAFRVGELVAGLRAAVARRDWVDATFAAAGALQAVDDAVAGTSSYGGRALLMLAQQQGRLADATLSLERTCAAARDLVPFPRGRRHVLPEFRRVLAELAVRAATRAISRDPEPGEACNELMELLDVLVERLPGRLQAAVARIPSSFCAFDDHLDDVVELGSRIAAAEGSPRPVVVVGVRTSGSYLAPVLAAQLRRCGLRDVRIASARPHQPLSRDDAAAVRRAVARGGLVVVTDDSPATGSAVASVCSALSAYGAGPGDICLALLLSPDVTGLPPALSGYRAVTLPWEEWSIHERLSVPHVRRSLQDLLSPGLVGECALVSRARAARGHQRAVFSVDVERSGTVRTLRVAAEGVGLGYFGDHDLTVMTRLQELAPRVLGVVDGLLFREWLPDEAAREPTTAEVVDHIRQRAAALAVPEDRSPGLAGAQPVWEVASERLAVPYGRVGPLARAVFLDRLVRELVRVDSPSVPDCAMAGRRWFVRDGRILKVGVAGSLFDNRNLISYDAAYDAVGFAVSHAATDLAEHIRFLFSAGVAPLGPEKWLLYELVHIGDRLSAGVVAPERARSLQCRALRRYLSVVLLSDVKRNRSGPVVAVDVDGVLEGRAFGFDAPTPSSVLAVRSLLRHGFRPVAVTGRCVEDVTELMDLLLLSAGVAEYGATVVLPDGTVQPTTTARQLAGVADVRARLRTIAGVHVDERYRSVARAWFPEPGGGRTGLDDATVRAVTTAAVHPVRGHEQTDFVPAGMDKTVGIDALLHALDATRPVLAVGDTNSDIGMLRSAARSAVPAHASAGARSAADRTTRHPYQEGFAEAVADLVGHRVGGCPDCAPPVAAAPTAALLSLLAVADVPRARAPWRTMQSMNRLRQLAREGDRRL